MDFPIRLNRLENAFEPATRAVLGALFCIASLAATMPACPDQLQGGSFNTPCTSDSQCLPGQFCDVDRELCMGTPTPDPDTSIKDGAGDSTVDGADAEVPPQGCTSTPDCWAFEDGNLCNGFMMCAAGKCVLNPATIVTCPAGTPCEPNVCNPDSGYCEATVVPGCADTPCQTAAECPSAGPCQVGVCVANKCGVAPLNCDDGDECTDDYCDQGCRNVPNFNDVCVEPPECEFSYQCTSTSNSLCGYQQCIDGKCVEVSTPSVEVCNDGQDNDCDGGIDCDDADCDGALACGSCATTPVSLKCNAWTSVSGLWSGAGINKYGCFNQQMGAQEMAFSFELPYAATVKVSARAEPEDAFLFVLEGSCTGESCIDVAQAASAKELPVDVAANTPIYLVLDHPTAPAVYEAEVFVECPQQEICQDFFDNDGDGAVDCADSDCTNIAPCEAVETKCNDGIDNDGDGAYDCEDSNCPPCSTPEVCNDGVDNDGDGATDCEDSDCSDAPGCGMGQCTALLSLLCNGAPTGLGLSGSTNAVSQYDCVPGAFNGSEVAFEYKAQSSGLVTWLVEADWDSSDTFAFVLAQSCDGSQCLSSDQIFGGGKLQFEAVQGQTYYLVVDGPNGSPYVYGSELICEGSQTENCFDGLDNDGDGDADCVDEDCNGVGACQSFETNCIDGFDNDGDGQTDCQEPWCQDNVPACGPTPQCNVAGELACFGGGFLEPVEFPESILDSYDCLPGNYPGREVVYTFTAGSTGSIQWFGFAEPFEQTSSFLLEANCDGDNCIAANGFGFEPLIANVVEGQTYYLVIDAQFDTDIFVFDSFLECFGPENCSDGQDNDGDGYADCADSECAGQGACQSEETNCTDGFDNDGDGQTDCQEIWCKANSPLCGFNEVCGDDVDNDGDGYTDCADAECASQGMCPAQQCTDVQLYLPCNQTNFDSPPMGNNHIDAYSCSQEQMPGTETIFSLESGLDGPVSFSAYTDFQGGARAMLLTNSCSSNSCQQMAFQNFEGQLELTFLADPDVNYWIVVDGISPWETYVWESSLTCL